MFAPQILFVEYVYLLTIAIAVKDIWEHNVNCNIVLGNFQMILLFAQEMALVLITTIANAILAMLALIVKFLYLFGLVIKVIYGAIL